MGRPWSRLGFDPARVCAVALGLALATAAPAQNNICNPGETPDVIVADLHELENHGELGGIWAFSIGTVSCNVGSCWLNWIPDTNEHPVIGQNMFRLKDGRFEQLGQSWLKHGFFAQDDRFCSNACIPADGEHLGVNCSDPYSASLNGNQNRLGPKSEVNPSTGDFPYPHTGIGETGDTLFKRIQVHEDDLLVGLNPGALYFAEGQYVTADDAAAGNDHNNVSHRPLDVTGGGSFFVVTLSGATTSGPAIDAWQANESGVSRVDVDVPNDGRFVLAAKATDLGNGTWHYEYAIQNLTSHRSAMSFEVPIPTGASVTNVGFHDVDYHSGEPYDGTDWSSSVDSTEHPLAVYWTTDPFGEDPDANALRWGTLYNFWFDVDVAPVSTEVSLGLFRPGTPASMLVTTVAPEPCDADGFCDPGEGCACATDCGPPPPSESVCDDGIDDDCDGVADCLDPDCCSDVLCEDGIDLDGDGAAACDCDDDNDEVWATPGEALDLLLVEGGPSGTVLDWNAPTEPGGVLWSYEALRSTSPADFVSGALCLPLADPRIPTAVDMETPAPGVLFCYLARAENACPSGSGEGSLGPSPQGGTRNGIGCP